MPQACPAQPAATGAAAPDPAPLPDLAALRAAWRARRPPADPVEDHALEALVSTVWRSHRLAALELRLLEALLAGEAGGPLPSLATLVRYGNRLERVRRAAELELERLRREPRPAPTSAPATPEPAVPDPRGEASGEAEHGAPEPPVEPAPAAADRAEGEAPEPARAAAEATGGGSRHAAPEPRGSAAGPRVTGPFGSAPLASPTSAVRAAGRLSTSSVGLVAGLDAAGVPLPVLPPFPWAASAGRARAQRA
jgi:translation initiation factor IF-2